MPTTLHRSYPHIQFKRHWEISASTWRQLGQCEEMIRAICRIPIEPDRYDRLLQVALVKGAQATTAIEGNTLSDAEVERVSRGQELSPSKRYQQQEVTNVLDAMNSLDKTVISDNEGQLITPKLIRDFHQRIGKELGEHFDAIPGQLRTDERVVGPYRCPDHRDVPPLLEKFCTWLRSEFSYSDGNQDIPNAIIEAIVAHVYLEWIHPFGDGNGRTGRLLEFYVLLRAGCPDITSHILSNFYNLTRPRYYRELQKAEQSRDLSSFLDYAITGYRDGLREIIVELEASQFNTAWRSHIFEVFARTEYTHKRVFKRQRDLMLAIPSEGGVQRSKLANLSPTIARHYAALSQKTLDRDIDALLKLDLLLEVEGGGLAARTGILRKQMPNRRPPGISTTPTAG